MKMSLSRRLREGLHRLVCPAALLIGRTDLALAHWRRLQILRPDDAGVPAGLAHLLAARGERAAAIALLRRSLLLDPQRAVVWFNLAFVQQQEALHEQALHSFDQALRLDEKLDRACYGKALSLIKLGRADQAIVLLERTIELQPMSPYGWYQLAHVHCRLGDPDAARRVIRELSGFEPQVARQLERETGLKR